MLKTSGKAVPSNFLAIKGSQNPDLDAWIIFQDVGLRESKAIERSNITKRIFLTESYKGGADRMYTIKAGATPAKAREPRENFYAKTAQR